MSLRVFLTAYIEAGFLSDETNDGVKKQIQYLEELVTKLQLLNKNFNQWYILAEGEGIPPLKTKFPSDLASKKIIQMKKDDPFTILTIWNGLLDKHVSITLFDLMVQIDVLDGTWLENINEYIAMSKTILEIFPSKYFFIKPEDIFENQVFEHRYPCTSIVFIPSKLENNDLPMVDEIIPIHTEKNTGSLIILDKNNYFNQHENIDEKVNKFAVALVDLDLLPTFDY